MGKGCASISFYIFALAAQVSGFTSPLFALALTLVATVFLILAAWDWAHQRGWSLASLNMSGLGNGYVLLSDGAQRAFDKTLVAHGYDSTAADRVYHHIVILALEAQHHPSRLGLFRSIPPGTQIQRIPTDQIDVKTISRDGRAIGADLYSHPDRVQWSPIYVKQSELKQHIERLKNGETYGQSPAR